MNKQANKSKNPDHLYQRNGIWWIRYSLGGQKVRASLHTRSLHQAKKRRDLILAKRDLYDKFGLEEPKRPKPVPTFKQIAEMWLNSREADDSLRQSTRIGTRRIVERHFIPRFGSMLMTQIGVEQIEAFIGDLRKEYARATVYKLFSDLRAMFRHAIRRRWFTGPNPFDQLERKPSSGPGRDTVLTEAEAIALLGELTGELYCKSALALYTGLRWGEVHGLGWADLALVIEPPTLTVRRSFRGPPKNEASAATVPLNREAAALLRRRQMEKQDDCLWLFPDAKGNLRAQVYRRDSEALHRATKSAGIKKHITPHVFRHTFGTWVYERTGDPKIVQRLMRHASFQTSMGYVHDRRELAPVVNLLPDLTSKHNLRLV